MKSSRGKHSPSLIYAGTFIIYLGMLIVCVLSWSDATQELDQTRKKLDQAGADVGEDQLRSREINHLESAVSKAQVDHDTALFAMIIVGSIFFILSGLMLITWLYSRESSLVEVRKNWFEVLLPALVLVVAMLIFWGLDQWLPSDVVSRMRATTMVTLLQVVLVAGIWKAGSAAFLAYTHAKERWEKSETEELSDKIDLLLEKVQELGDKSGLLQKEVEDLGNQITYIEAGSKQKARQRVFDLFRKH